MQARVLFATAVTAAALACSTSAIAQMQRVFPQTALRGALVVGDPPDVLLNGRPARLAPGAKIRDASNLLAMSGTLIGAKLLVHYTLDTADLIQDVWILTPDEAAKRPWPATRRQQEDWLFDPTSQTWSRP